MASLSGALERQTPAAACEGCARALAEQIKSNQVYFERETTLVSMKKMFVHAKFSRCNTVITINNVQ